LVETCGIYTTKQASPTKDFDALMAHFASIAGDEAWIRRTAEGDERRMRHLIRQEINAGQISEPYIAGILRNMNIDANLVDVPAAHLWKLWNALKRHNARHAATQHACA